MEIKYNTIEYDICETQANFFEYVAENNIDFEWFIDFYMNSDFCNREIDSSYSFYHIAFPGELMEFVEIEARKKGVEIVKTDKHFRRDIANFVGFTYRYLHYVTGLSSKELIKAVPFIKLCNAFAMHTLDESVAADILCDQFGLPKVG